MTRKLTLKQSQFIKKFFECKGNGTEAAMQVYDVKSRNVAKVIASQNLTKLNVQQKIRSLLSAEEGNISDCIKNLITVANAKPKSVPASTTLRANIELIKLKQMYT